MVLAIPNSSALEAGAAAKARKTSNARWKGAAAAVGLGVAIGSASTYYNKSSARSKQLKLLKNNASSSSSRPRMHHLAVDAICGAVGEVAGLVALYPLDTIKVKCQAGNIGAGQALRETLALGPRNAIRTLYAGMGSTALGAAAIGSLYLLTFYAAKRAGTSISSLSSAAKGEKESTTSSSSSASPLVASAAGAAASIVGSIIEAPIEAFKVRAQAGASGSGKGSMLGSMASLVVTQGFAPLYCSFLPFLLKSIPHDVAELFTYSQINEMVSTSSTSEQKSGGRIATPAAAMLSQLPIEARDMLIGAASGAAAAIASMPFDVTFTRMQLGTGIAVAAGTSSVGNSLSNFAATVRLIVAQGGGPHALFAGVVPRLLQTIPAGMVYWAAVEATRRALENKYEVEKPAEAAATAASQSDLTHSSDIVYSSSDELTPMSLSPHVAATLPSSSGLLLAPPAAVLAPPPMPAVA